MTCEPYTEDVSALLDRELPEDRQADLFAHLAVCSPCRHSLASIQSLHSELKGVPAPRIPRSLDVRVEKLAARRFMTQNTILEAVRQFWSDRLVIPAPAFAAGVFALLLAVTVTVAALRGSFAPATEQPPQVTYIMSLPTVEVRGVPLRTLDAVQ